jgi:hypothetical protein
LPCRGTRRTRRAPCCSTVADRRNPSPWCTEVPRRRGRLPSRLRRRPRTRCLPSTHPTRKEKGVPQSKRRGHRRCRFRRLPRCLPAVLPTVRRPRQSPRRRSRERFLRHRLLPSSTCRRWRAPKVGSSGDPRTRTRTRRPRPP